MRKEHSRTKPKDMEDYLEDIKIVFLHTLSVELTAEILNKDRGTIHKHLLNMNINPTEVRKIFKKNKKPMRMSIGEAKRKQTEELDKKLIKKGAMEKINNGKSYKEYLEKVKNSHR